MKYHVSVVDAAKKEFMKSYQSAQKKAFVQPFNTAQWQWPPGSLHTMGADGNIKQRDRLFMWIKILCIEYILWGIPTIEYTFDVANMVKTATVKDVPMNNDALLNIQAC